MATTNLRDGIAYVPLAIGIVVLSAAFAFAIPSIKQIILSNSTDVRAQERWLITTGGEVNVGEPFDLQSDCEAARLAKFNFATDQWQQAHDNYRDTDFSKATSNVMVSVMGPVIKQTMDDLVYKLKLAKSAYCSRH